MNRDQKILLVSHEMTYTGAPRSLLNIARLLQEAGIIVSVWTLEDGGFHVEFEKEKILVDMFPENVDDEVIKDFDLIILNTFFTAHLVERFQKLTRTILYIREAQNITDLVKDCKLSVLHIKNANEVICVSEYAECFIREYCMPHKLTVLHNFVKDTYHYRNLNFVKDGKVNFLLSGTYEERKGYDIAIAAFIRMPDKLKKITRLHIIGHMPEWSRQFWEELRDEYDDRIIEYGEIADEKQRLALYRKMNVFLIPSRDEACSLVALEGAMLGKTLIMSKNVGAQYLDRKGENIYPTEDVDALCRKMCESTSRKILLLRGLEMRKAYKRTSTEKRYREKLWEIIEYEQY